MKTPTLLLHLGLLFTILLGARLLPADDAAATYLLQSGRQPGQIDRVQIVLEIAGDRLDPAGDQVQRLALSGSGNFAYDEKTLEVAATPEGHSRSVRYYDDARAVIKVADKSEKHSLPAARRLIAVDVDAGKATLFSPRGMLTSDELELIDISANTLLLDSLLPAKPVAVGQKWRPADKVLGMILQLDEVRRSQVECLLKEVTPAVARIELAGSLSGNFHGVPCQFDVEAKCRFDRQSNRIDWVAMRIDDKREPSGVVQGLDAVATWKIRISPKSESLWLTPRVLADAPAAPSAELCRLLCQPAEAAWQLPHDRCWFLVEEHRDSVALRMMAGGANVAQCNVSSLAKVAVDACPRWNSSRARCGRPWARASVSSSRPANWPARPITASTGWWSRARFPTCRSSGITTWWPTSTAGKPPWHSPSRSKTSRPSTRRASGLVRGLRFLDPQAAASRAVSRPLGRAALLPCAEKQPPSRGIQDGGLWNQGLPPIATGCVAARRAGVGRAIAQAALLTPADAKGLAPPSE